MPRPAGKLLAAAQLMVWSAAGLSACGGEAEHGSAGPAPPPQTGAASFYARELAGEPTASGEPLDPGEMTAAHRTLPLGARAKVTNHETGRSVTVEINDRGPYARNRIVDVTPKAADKLGMKEDGVATVSVQPLGVTKK